MHCIFFKVCIILYAFLTEHKRSGCGGKNVLLSGWEDGGRRAEGELYPGGSADSGSRELQV